MKIAYLTVAAAACASVIATPALAEKRQHGAHEHGVASLQLAIDDNQVLLTFDSPLFNLTGFGSPSSEEDHHAMEELAHALREPSEFFLLNGKPCHVLSTEIEGDLFAASSEMHEEHHDEHDEDHHDDHGKDEHDEKHDDDHHDDHEKDEHHDEHDDDHEKDEHHDKHDDDHQDDHEKDEHHDKHDDDHHDDHGKDEHHDKHDDDHHDEHGEDEHHDEHEGHDHEEGGHNDVEVEWLLECNHLGKSPSFGVTLFEEFDHLELLNVEYLMGSRQGAVKLTPDNAESNL